MKTTIDLKPTLNFLRQLQKNNNKPWFDQHRAAYETARGSFEELVNVLIDELSRYENLAGVSAKDCMFRINRDVRFSRDKSPYKTNMGASIAPGGRKAQTMGYYIHIAPHDESMLAGGLHMPMPAQLAKFRQAVDRDAREFKKITSSKSFVQYFGKIEGDKLSTAPQGYPRDHPQIELLKLKQVVTAHHLSDEQVLSPDLANHTIKAFKAMKPFLDYLNIILQP
jgi:uncharacterized protein (TIGR02453 family)